jgi:hypothetical protein
LDKPARGKVLAPSTLAPRHLLDTSAPVQHLLGTSAPAQHLLGTSAHFTMGTFGTFSTCNRFSIILSAFLSTLR